MSAVKTHHHLAALLDRELYWYRLSGETITPELIEALSKTYLGQCAQLADAWNDLVGALKLAVGWHR
jgi:hypothetical protein